jgi:adenine deaminase
LPAAPFEFDFEEAQLTEQNVRDLVFQEMVYYHPELMHVQGVQPHMQGVVPQMLQQRQYA